MTARKRVTIAQTWALVAMTVAFALAGFLQQAYGGWRIAALVAVLSIFSWLLSETLETFLEHRRRKNWRAWVTGAAGVFLYCTEVHLVHYGLAWLFGDLGNVTLYAMSAGFALLNVAAKAIYGFTYDTEPEAAKAATPAPAPFTVEGIAYSTEPRAPSAEVIRLDKRDFASSHEAVSAILETYRGAATA